VPAHRLTDAVIDTEETLRALIGEPTAIVCAKISERLNPLTRQYIEHSTFMLVATSDPTGSCDVSPRGDPAGFDRILDETTLLLPGRPQ
jgi:predicted pyridoxine 5'-phosphate oxidase superfamily flavin-nucleotide-binding protein